MSSAYGDPVDVQARDDGRPTGFVWQNRRYTVRVILEHWVINRDWWRDPQAEPGQLELELWRVQASPTPAVPACPYDLRREAATNAWTLTPARGRLVGIHRARADTPGPAVLPRQLLAELAKRLVKRIIDIGRYRLRRPRIPQHNQPALSISRARPGTTIVTPNRT